MIRPRTKRRASESLRTDPSSVEHSSGRMGMERLEEMAAGVGNPCYCAANQARYASSLPSTSIALIIFFSLS